MLYTCIIQIFDYKQYYYYMGYNKILFLISLILLVSPGVKAEDIQIYNFEELINSNPASGDVFEFNNNLDSDASIGNHFFNLDLTFEGNHHYLDGNNTFSGFILNQDSLFNEIEIQNCKGQEYQGSDFAGAVFNFNGHMDIQNSGFTQNFVEASGFDYAIGGAAYNLNSGVINIDSTNFNGNYAHGALSAGGAIANGFSTSDNPDMSINNSVFENNDTAASVTSEGGALYNKGTIDINNSVFKGNYATTEDEQISFVYGGAVSNAGNMTINNTSINGNYVEGNGSQSAVLGGAIYNSANLTVNNSTLNGNYADSPFYAEGGAIYNDVNGTTTIKNSVIENNRVSSQAQFSEGGAIYNAGRLIVEGSTFKSNLDKDGELNDIYNRKYFSINSFPFGLNSKELMADMINSQLRNRSHSNFNLSLPWSFLNLHDFFSGRILHLSRFNGVRCSTNDWMISVSDDSDVTTFNTCPTSRFSWVFLIT